MKTNSLRTIHPYRTQGGVWCFDDAQTGLEREPFVGAVNDLLDHFTAHIPGADAGVTCLFSADPFPGWALCLDWVGEFFSGNTYRCGEVEGWLCPALLRYFPAAPKQIYAAFLPIERARKSNPQPTQNYVEKK